MGISIEGKCAIVTGAANGVGLAIARTFVQAGANVVLSDMDEENLNLETESLQTNGGKALAFCGDLREKLTINNLLASAIDNFKTVDILINASRQVLTSNALKPEDDTFGQLMDQNVNVGLRLSQAVAKRMIANNQDRVPGEIIGNIVFLTSIASNRTQPNILSYSVSSAAVDQMTRSMAVALASEGIRVNAISIGSVMSESLRNLMREDLDIHDLVIESTPLGRIGEAKEAAQAALFLASDLANFITGHVLTIDGGRSLLDRMPHSAY